MPSDLLNEGDSPTQQSTRESVMPPNHEPGPGLGFEQEEELAGDRPPESAWEEPPATDDTTDAAAFEEGVGSGKGDGLVTQKKGGLWAKLRMSIGIEKGGSKELMAGGNSSNAKARTEAMRLASKQRSLSKEAAKAPRAPYGTHESERRSKQASFAKSGRSPSTLSADSGASSSTRRRSSVGEKTWHLSGGRRWWV
eukprot:TRINITY_DN10442_c0_g2_i1.p1 TRINITY_DN10442_c0_g2~~TRINITY_DN10442_c0_g2_i1.p1  ORF type:complete len:215 (-),score=36.56 TRINITY_DN10442_c0_g2_i1:40-627(-)